MKFEPASDQMLLMLRGCLAREGTTDPGGPRVHRPDIVGPLVARIDKVEAELRDFKRKNETQACMIRGITERAEKSEIKIKMEEALQRVFEELNAMSPEEFRAELDKCEWGCDENHNRPA
jgi:hypothetical protein